MCTKKLKIVAVFFVGILAVFSLIVSRNFFQTRTAHGDTISNLTVYADSLSSQFSNWSWGSSLNLSNSSPVFEGSSSISFTPNAWGGLYLHSSKPIDPSSYQSLQFALQTNVQVKNLTLLIYGTNNQQLKSLSLSQYTGVGEKEWKVYTIPLSVIPQPISGIALQETSGTAGATIFVDAIQFIAHQPIPTMTSAPKTEAVNIPQSTIRTNAKDPLANQTFFNNPDSNPAQKQAQQWQSSRPNDAITIRKIADQPKAMWIGNWSGNVQSAVQHIVTKSSASGTVPMFVAYNIPKRDCGSYSAGGSNSTQSYDAWISAFAKGIGSHRAAIVLEPDAVSQITCLSSSDQTQRYAMLSYAVNTFKALGNTAVYIDAGNAGWISVSDMAHRLQQAGIPQADGFALNVSNFKTNSDSITYGTQLSEKTGGKHFIIDTSRNGNGPTSDNAWCNPSGRALGMKPTTQTNNSLVDAYAWIKYPGESDGSCNGAPVAGAWYPDYALGLAQRANW